MTIAALTALFLSGCATVDSRLKDAADRQGVLAAGRSIPDLPGECRKRERSGVLKGDPLDTALIKTDRALGRANARVTRCAEWHDQVRGAIEGGGG
jgi:hypothetical protein